MDPIRKEMPPFSWHYTRYSPMVPRLSQFYRNCGRLGTPLGVGQITFH